LNNLLKIFVAATLLTATACGPRIYQSKDLPSAVRTHKTVAILPAQVTVKLRPNEAKRMTADQLEDLQERTALDIQDKMHGWLLNRSDRFHYSVSFQDVSRTNARLREAGMDVGDLSASDRGEIAKALGVDAVIQSRLVMDKPMSDGAAVAIGLLVGAWGSTNNVQSTINIHDGTSGNLLWKYDYQASGSVGSSTQGLVDALMRNATRHFPYKDK
jgi:hypothetical protein